MRMKLDIYIFPFLSVIILIADASYLSYFNPRRHNTPLKVSDEETASRLNAHFENSLLQAWQKRTKENADPPTIVAETLGNTTITGKLMTSYHNRTIYAFQGFKYGLAERFMPPTSQGVFWDGDTFEAIHIGFKCPQGALAGNQPAGNEDCLYLNVYTPMLPPPTGDALLPVIFYIHGGSFVNGDSSFYMPTRLLDHDVILVTIHYRLGAFGFFTLNNEKAPGNLALYDMVEALRWVQTHITDFGGDPDKVTVMGESAGSVAANYMMLVKPAEGLLRAVIADSGSCFDHWGFDENSTYASHYLAEWLDCKKETDDLTLECMKNVDMEDLVHAQANLSLTDRHNGLVGFRGTSPTLQNFTLSPDAGFELILDKRPIDYFKTGNFSKVPFMTGSNKDEGTFVATLILNDYVVYHNLTKNTTYLREQLLQDLLGAMGVTDDTHSIATSLQEIYCPGIDLGDILKAAPCLCDLVGVMFVKAGSWEVSNYHSLYSDQKTFYYSFEFESDDSMFKFTGLDFDGGVTHVDDLLYLFSLPAIMDDYPGQLETMDRMTKLWTNFAIYLNPTPEDHLSELAKQGIPQWTPFQFEDHHLLVIDKTLKIDKEFSDRWTPMMDKVYGRVTVEEKCTYRCADYKDQKTAFMATMITFIVLFVISVLVAVYFFFKARQ